MDFPEGGTPITHEECDARWRGWTPGEIHDRLAGVTAPWYVAAGWALDLFRGEVTREHEDLEIAVPRGSFPEIHAALPGYTWEVPGDMRLWPYDEAGDHPELHQTWLSDPATGLFHLDVFREPHDGGRWVCRRDPTISLPYPEIIALTGDGIPYLIPELVLLFKAKNVRPKDQNDFDGVLPQLGPDRRARLAAWLGQVHPEHAWLSAL
ncbi:nucleotidyltransferase domain-containing protein [Longispora urticae]